MSLAIDGTAQGHQGTSSTVTATLTTANANDYIIVCIYSQSNMVSVSGSTLGAFTQIATLGGANNSSVYAIFSSGALTNEVITATQTSASTITIDCFGVSGSNQTSLVFDSGGPVTGGSGPLSFTNANANIMLIGTFGWFIANPDAGSGFTAVPGSGPFSLISEYKILSSTTTTSVATGNDGLTFSAAAVGIVQASGVVASPFNQSVWPLPIFPPSLLQSWAWSQTRMLGQDRLPNRQRDWPNPTQPSRLDQFIGWRQTRMFGQDRLPFNQDDWPLSALHNLPRIDQTWVRRQTGMFGQDQLPFRQQDWPNPTQPPPAQTWLWRQTGMLGQDRLPFRQQDWPNPVQPPPVQTWLWRQTGMQGQDTLPFRQQDWPNSTLPYRIDQTWTQGFNLNLATVVVTFPFRQQDWPNPTQPSRLDQTWAWSQTDMIGQDRLPFRQQDWPNPTPPYRIDQTWARSQTGMLGQDTLPFRQQDWPLTRLLPDLYRSWTWQQTGMFGQDVLPFRQQDWPNPTQPPRLDQTWLQGFSLVISVVPVFIPHNQFDWPNPIPPPRLDQSWGWRQLGMLGQDVLPNRQQDWPNPTQPPRLDQTLTWRQTSMLGQDQLANRQQDWPNPTGHYFILEPGRGYAIPPGINLLPPPPPVVTVALHAPHFFSTMGMSVGAPANPPS